MFQNGILPLDQIIDEIWDNIRSIWISISEGEFIKFKTNYIFDSDLYELKIRNKQHNGPFAVLIKDVSFNSKEQGIHNYLAEPEIIRDIFDEIEARYGVDLRTEYQNKTKPAIVKFFHSDCAEQKIGNAMRYLYAKYYETGDELRANTYFDGHGEKIPSNSIEYVQIL